MTLEIMPDGRINSYCGGLGLRGVRVMRDFLWERERHFAREKRNGRPVEVYMCERDDGAGPEKRKQDAT